ncbi:BTAD domain-containing putative transcriptional regulator [Streptacidiphilus sp. EB103A]|uniref:AfsR/SARP family transcriptional regulator n=1 Tax=Streptacidiphilus sp. EB103A TaxID=3156275 RepID=UPI0035178EA9
MAMKYGLLGPLTIESEGQQVQIPGPRLRAALTMLLLQNGSPVAVEQFIDGLWGERSPQTARAQIHNIISKLRKALPAEAGEHLKLINGAYQLTLPPDAIDATRFIASVRAARAAVKTGPTSASIAELRTALALWRGEPLSGIEAPFAEPARARLEETRFAAHELLADMELAAGRHHELIPELTALLDRYPAREHLGERLMLALYRSGRRTDALAVARRLRTLLAGEYGLDPGAGFAELEQGILRGDRALLDPEPKPEPVPRRDTKGGRASGAVPSQLPLGTVGFVGRAEELKQLDHGIEALSGEPGVLLVTGPAGSGKTTLALRWARAKQDLFPDGTLFADLRGYDQDSPDSPVRVLERFLLAMGVPGPGIPSDFAAREDLYRSWLADRRVLLLLDNAGDYSQIQSLLPGSPGSLTVVTSRDALGGLVVRTGAITVRLGMLPLDDSVEVLRRSAGATRVADAPEAALALARLCGGLPLALRIAAARLVEQPTLSLKQLADELAADGRLLDGLALSDGESAVARTLDHTYRRLPAELARTFRLMGLHNGPGLGPGAVGALLGETDGASIAAPRLRALEAVHLVARSGSGTVSQDHCAMHDLVRLYALSRTEAEETPQERREALSRLADWYVALGEAGTRLIMPERPLAQFELKWHASDRIPFTDAEQAMAWFDDEAENMLALTRQCATLGQHTAVWQLADVQMIHQMRRHLLDNMLETQKLGEAAATASGSDDAVGKLANSVGIAHSLRREFPEAVAAYERSLAAYLRAGDHFRAAVGQMNLGSLHYDFGQFTEARAHLRQSAEMLRGLGEHRLLGICLGNLGLTYSDQGDMPAARELLEEAVAMAEKAGAGDQIYIIRGDLAEVYLLLGKYAEGVEGTTTALASARFHGDRLHTGRLLRQLGDAESEAGNAAQASTAWEESLQVLAELDSPECEELRDRLAGRRYRPFRKR